MAALTPQPCPRCGNLSDSFVGIDPGMRTALEETGQGANVPEKVCQACYESVTSQVSQGLKLRMEANQREKNKMMVWKNRVHLIKNARNLMTQKAYSEAAVQYEKYLRVLEVVYNLKKGELSPAVFNNSSRSKELTVIASVYWDLVRIYDTSPRYGDRMSKSAEKLAQFLQFSPIFPDIMRKAEAFAKTAKNQQVMRNFMRSTRSKRGPCFIATAVYADDPYALELTLLRNFRDRRLRPYWLGRQMIWAYYRLSPTIATWLTGSPASRAFARKGLSAFTQKF